MKIMHGSNNDNNCIVNSINAISGTNYILGICFSTKILIFNSTIDFCSFPEKSANIVDGDSKEIKKEICFCVCMLAICMRK